MKKQYSIPEIDIIRFEDDSDILTLSLDGSGDAVGGEGSIGGWGSWANNDSGASTDSNEVKSIFD